MNGAHNGNLIEVQSSEMSTGGEVVSGGYGRGDTKIQITQAYLLQFKDTWTSFHEKKSVLYISNLGIGIGVLWIFSEPALAFYLCQSISVRGPISGWNGPLELMSLVARLVPWNV